MYGMDEEFKIRRGGKTARPIALTMRAVPFEAMMAVSTVALVAALAALICKGYFEWTAWMKKSTRKRRQLTPTICDDVINHSSP